MKHFIVAGVVLAIILSLGIFEQIYVKNTFKEFDNRLEELSWLTEKDDLNTAAAKAHEFEKWWIKRLRVCEIMTHNRDLPDTTKEITILYGCLMTKDKERAMVSLHTLSVMSKNLHYTLGFRIEHIA